MSAIQRVRFERRAQSISLFAGGYRDDSHPQGTAESETYLLDTWETVDTFIYFSHNLVTIPPTGWINAGHANGVPVIGTLITEWDAGTEACKSLFCDAETASHMAEQLVKVARHFGFDGWLVRADTEKHSFIDA